MELPYDPEYLLEGLHGLSILSGDCLQGSLDSCIVDFGWVLPLIPYAILAEKKWREVRDRMEAYSNLIGPISPCIADDARKHPSALGTPFHQPNKLGPDKPPRAILARIRGVKKTLPNRLAFGGEYSTGFSEWLCNEYKARNKSGKPTFPIETDFNTYAHERLSYETDVARIEEPNIIFKSETMGEMYKEIRDSKPLQCHLLIVKIPYPFPSAVRLPNPPYHYGIVIAGDCWQGTEAFPWAIWKYGQDIYREVGNGSFMAMFPINLLQLDRKQILRAVPKSIGKPKILKIRLNSEESRFIETN